MKSQKQKISILVALAFILVLSTFIALFNYSPIKKAHAFSTAELDNLVIKSAKVVERKNYLTNCSEWAIMFRAEIDEESYNSITNNGTDNVKFGMLIGPTILVGAIVDYDSAIENKFVSFSHVGTASAGVQTISFTSSTYSYYAGIVYNEQYLSQNNISLFDVANLELTAIPFVSTPSDNYIVLANKKDCVPKTILVESYVQEQAQGVNNISLSSVSEYAGAFTEQSGEYYICASTNRLLYAKSYQGDLKPISLELSDSDKLYIAGKKQECVDTKNIQSSTMLNLVHGNSYGVTIYTADGKIINHTAKVATKVFMRMTKEGAYPDGSDATTINDYYAYNISNAKEEDTEGLHTFPTNEPRAYMSVFAVGQKLVGVTGQTISINTRVPTDAIDGYYVLASDIFPTQIMASVHTVPYWQHFYPAEGKGFIGTFDGRGKTFWTKSPDNIGYKDFYIGQHLNGIFPTIYGGTVKNFGCVLKSTGGYYKTTPLFASAKYATFENVYVRVDSVDNYQNKYNIPSLGSMEDCTIKNFLIEANCADTNIDIPENVSAGTGEQFNGLLAFHRHSLGDLGNPITDIFAGNTATNLFAVGSSQLFVQHEMAKGYAITNKVTYVVNPDSVLAGDNSNYKTASELSGEQLKLFNAYNELATIHKKFIHTVPVAEEFLSTNSLQIRFASKQGFYNMDNGKQMQDHLLNNPSELQLFAGKEGNGCWSVDYATGRVSWNFQY